MKKLEMFAKVIGDLQQTEYFKDFTFLKSRRILIQKDNLGSFWVRFRTLDGIKDNALTLELDFGIARRYDILHKWFEPFWRYPIREQRIASTVGFPVWDKDWNYRHSLHWDFRLDGVDYEKDFIEMYNRIIPQCRYQQNRFKTLQDMYDVYIDDILNGNINRVITPQDDVFVYMALCLIVNPAKYPILKQFYMELIDKRLKKGDPNFTKYGDINSFHEIFNYMENYDFSKELKKCGL